MAVRGGTQQRERMRRIGVLMHLAADDREGQSRLAAFLQGLQEAGWAVGRNVTIDVRWAAADVESMKPFAKELVALQPDLIFTSSKSFTHGLQARDRLGPSGIKKTGGERKLYQDILFHFQASLPAYFLAGRCIGVTPTCSSAVYGAP